MLCFVAAVVLHIVYVVRGRRNIRPKDAASSVGALSTSLDTDRSFKSNMNGWVKPFLEDRQGAVIINPIYQSTTNEGSQGLSGLPSNDIVLDGSDRKSLDIEGDAHSEHYGSYFEPEE